jgi:hypothetical protein
MATAGRLPEVAFFATLGGAGSDNTFAQMSSIVGKTPRAVCAITEREVAPGNHLERLSAFVKVLELDPSHAAQSPKRRSLRRVS